MKKSSATPTCLHILKIRYFSKGTCTHPERKARNIKRVGSSKILLITESEGCISFQNLEKLFQKN